jgi:hypothetical protein
MFLCLNVLAAFINDEVGGKKLCAFSNELVDNVNRSFMILISSIDERKVG